MGNKITDEVKLGTLGELLVQIRLLQFGIQSAPPIKDSGNDLIAGRGDIFRSIQVKTTSLANLKRPRDLPLHFHFLALVRIEANDTALLLDQSSIFLVPREAIVGRRGMPKPLSKYTVTKELLDEYFPEPGIQE